MERLEVAMEVAGEIKDKEKAHAMVEDMGEAIKEFFLKMSEAGITGQMDMEFTAWSVEVDESLEEPEEEPVVEFKESVLKKMEQLLEVQRLALETDLFWEDESFIGVYNGMETIMATLYERKPKLVEVGEQKKGGEG